MAHQMSDNITNSNAILADSLEHGPARADSADGITVRGRGVARLRLLWERRPFILLS